MCTHTQTHMHPLFCVMRMCMCACMRTHTCKSIQRACVCMRAHAAVCASTYTRERTGTHTCTRTHPSEVMGSDIHTQGHAHTHTHTHTQDHAIGHIHTHGDAHANTCARALIGPCNWSTGQLRRDGGVLGAAWGAPSRLTLPAAPRAQQQAEDSQPQVRLCAFSDRPSVCITVKFQRSERTGIKSHAMMSWVLWKRGVLHTMMP